MARRTTAGVVLRGTASLAGILLILIGLPAVLLALGGNPLPSSVPSLEDVVGALSRPDDGTLLIGILTILGWIVWATLALSFLVETPAAVRGIPAPRLPGLSWQQGHVAALTGAVAAMIALAGTGAANASAATVSTGTAQAADTSQRPGGATAEDATASRGEKTITVRPGDTLWAIAETELGQGDRYPEIIRASEDVAQPDEARLTDSSDLRPGWRLTIPGTTTDGSAGEEATGGAQAQTPAPAAPQTTSDGEVVALERDMAQRFAGGGPTTPPPPATGAPMTSPGPAAPAAEAGADAPTSSAQAAAGLGSLACAGLVALLAGRRRRQQQRRRPGWRIALPTGRAALLEDRIAADADPTAGQDLDRALRHLADSAPRWPSLRAARLSRETIEVYLVEEDLDLPRPWHSAGGGTWVLERSDRPGRGPDDPGATPTPWPALVCLGRDEDEAQILLNLQQIGSLGLTGTGDVVTSVLTGIAVDLATAATRGTRVTVVGTMPDLVDAVDDPRLRYAPDLDTALKLLEAPGHEQHEVIVSAARVRPEQAKRWRALTAAAPDGALSLVAPGDAGTDWTLAVRSREPGPMAILHPVGMTLRAQHLTSSAYQDLLDLLTTTTAPDTPGGTPVSDAEALTLETIPQAGTTSLVAAAATEATTSLTRLEATGAPVIRVLGQVEVSAAPGPEPEDPETATELAALLALHPGSDDTGLAQEMALAPHTGIDATLGTVRRWLGTDHHGGPHVITGPDGHVLHDVTLDWNHLRTLIDDGPAHVDPERLKAALALVTSAPFDNAPTGRYHWARRDRHEISATISDIAHELATRCLRAGDPDAAAWAAEKGLLAEPLSETLWRDAIHAAWQTNQPDLIHTTVTAANQVPDLAPDLDAEATRAVTTSAGTCR